MANQPTTGRQDKDEARADAGTPGGNGPGQQGLCGGTGTCPAENPADLIDPETPPGGTNALNPAGGSVRPHKRKKK